MPAWISAPLAFAAFVWITYEIAKRDRARRLRASSGQIPMSNLSTSDVITYATYAISAAAASTGHIRSGRFGVSSRLRARAICSRSRAESMLAMA